MIVSVSVSLPALASSEMNLLDLPSDSIEFISNQVPIPPCPSSSSLVISSITHSVPLVSVLIFLFSTLPNDESENALPLPISKSSGCCSHWLNLEIGAVSRCPLAWIPGLLLDLGADFGVLPSLIFKQLLLLRLLDLKDCREAERKLRKRGRSVAKAAAEIPRPFSAVVLEGTMLVFDWRRGIMLLFGLDTYQLITHVQ